MVQVARNAAWVKKLLQTYRRMEHWLYNRRASDGPTYFSRHVNFESVIKNHRVHGHSVEGECRLTSKRGGRKSNESVVSSPSPSKIILSV